MRGAVQRRVRSVVTDEIMATIMDHVVSHGPSLREARERVQPNLRRSTAASICQTFQQTDRQVMHFMKAVIAVVPYNNHM